MDELIDTADDLVPLSDEEINAFFEDLDEDKDGYITFEELEAKLYQVHEELAPNPQKHNLNHPDRRDLEKNEGYAGDGLHLFLCSLMPNCGGRLDKADFVDRVGEWKVPSQKQTDSAEQDGEAQACERRLPLRRHIRAYWSIHGPVLWWATFAIFSPELGWGVIVAKASAGVLSPNLFFMLLSMSRHFSTFLRRSYFISRFINRDLSQALHIKMSIVGLFFASLHGIGHPTGTFLYGSSPTEQDDVALLLGPDSVPRPYAVYARSLPGLSGITALGLFWIISLLSVPFIRKLS
ncbi:hypothetical protein LTR85_001324 [Meristemomyces frigidus]|nr:hypothetical protein LTR85_001324 [Meristemomyces frigidus]